jgi:DNA-binding GntR family transcriptional regulator
MSGVTGGHERAILAESGQSPGPLQAAPGRPARADDSPRPATEVLADRIAVALAHHEPGWRLPRYSALARRYHVSTAEIDAAVDELAARRLIRRLPDGQLYRASPAEYLIPLEGVGGLVSHVDPMGTELTCRSRQVSWRRVPEDIRWALRIPPSEQVCVVRLAWMANGEPAAFTVTYLPEDMAGAFAGDDPAQGGLAEEELGAVAGLSVLPLTAAPAGPREGRAGLVPAGRPAALHIEMQPPPASLARNLRLSAGQPAAMVAVRFDDPEAVRPVALTVAAIRPELFRIVVETDDSPFPRGGEGGFPEGWAQAVEDRES